MLIGSIVMLKFDGIPKRHPCLLLGAIDDECVFILFTSFKISERGLGTSYFTSQEINNSSTQYTGSWYTRTLSELFLIDLENYDNLKHWSEARTIDLYFVSKEQLRNKKVKTLINSDAWNFIEQHYRIMLDILEQNKDLIFKYEISSEYINFFKEIDGSYKKNIDV